MLIREIVVEEITVFTVELPTLTGPPMLVFPPPVCIDTLGAPPPVAPPAQIVSE